MRDKSLVFKVLQHKSAGTFGYIIVTSYPYGIRAVNIPELFDAGVTKRHLNIIYKKWPSVRRDLKYFKLVKVRMYVKQL